MSFGINNNIFQPKAPKCLEESFRQFVTKLTPKRDKRPLNVKIKEHRKLEKSVDRKIKNSSTLLV